MSITPTAAQSIFSRYAAHDADSLRTSLRPATPPARAADIDQSAADLATNLAAKLAAKPGPVRSAPAADGARPTTFDTSHIPDLVTNLRHAADGSDTLKLYSMQATVEMVERIFAQLDVDGKGFLTKEDTGLSDRLFARLDANGDERISARELYTAIRADMDRAIEFDPVLEPAQFAERWFNALDWRRQGQLDRAATPIDPALFDQLANDDDPNIITLSNVREHLNNNLPSVDERAHLDNLAMQLYRKLGSSGFDQRPPENLHQIIDRVTNTPGHQLYLLKMLSTYYPHGLGMNHRA